MNKRSIRLIIGLMSLALLGVMAMQYYFLRQSYQMQSDVFDRSVNEALGSVAAKVAKQDAMNFLNTKAQHAEHQSDTYQSTKITEQKAQEISFGTSADNNPPSIKKLKKKITARERKLAVLRDSLKRMIMHKKMEDDMAG
ncbi:MAG: hypothetical protein ABIP28_10330, partial [Mucilaginibacter sp.]